MSEPLKADEPIRHVIPGILIHECGITLETTPDLDVNIANGAEVIKLSQQQFLVVIKYSQFLVHSDWS